jgi:D-alanyl-D-alanine carboxypeptidase
MLLWVRKGKPFSLGTYAPGAEDLVDVGDGHLLRRRVAEAFRELQAEAKRAGHAIVAVSGFRDHEQQARTHALWMDRHRAQAAGARSEEDLERKVGEFSAKSGHSEHQLGTTIDVSTPGTQPFNHAHAPSVFSTSCAGKWVRDNAHRFGFTLSYPYGREPLTCFNPEPWHLRYVGVALATALASRGATLEEHFRASFPKVAVPSTRHCPPTRVELDYERLSAKDCEEGRRDRIPSKVTE